MSDIDQYHKTYYQQNKEKILIYQNKYNNDNRDKIRQYQHDYYMKTQFHQEVEQRRLKKAIKPKKVKKHKIPISVEKVDEKPIKLIIYF